MTLDVNAAGRRLSVLRAIIDEVNRLAALVDADDSGGGSAATLLSAQAGVGQETPILELADGAGTPVLGYYPQVIDGVQDGGSFHLGDYNGGSPTSIDLWQYTDQAGFEITNSVAASNSYVGVSSTEAGSSFHVTAHSEQSGDALVVQDANGVLFTVTPAILAGESARAGSVGIFGDAAFAADAGPVLRSPDGTRYRLVVDDEGVLSTEAVV